MNYHNTDALDDAAPISQCFRASAVPSNTLMSQGSQLASSSPSRYLVIIFLILKEVSRENSFTFIREKLKLKRPRYRYIISFMPSTEICVWLARISDRNSEPFCDNLDPEPAGKDIKRNCSWMMTSLGFDLLVYSLLYYTMYLICAHE